MTETKKQTLRRIMREHGMSAQDVADATGRSVYAVYQWRSDRGAPLPAHMLELLQLKIQAGQIGGGTGEHAKPAAG